MDNGHAEPKADQTKWLTRQCLPKVYTHLVASYYHAFRNNRLYGIWHR